MPLIRRPPGLLLVCVNGCRPDGTTAGNQDIAGDGDTTMQAAPSWNALVVMSPDPPVSIDTQRGAPVRLYICSICGYTEVYAGIVIDSAVWPAD